MKLFRQGCKLEDALQGMFLILPLNEFPSDEEVREQAKDDVSIVLIVFYYQVK